MHRIQENVLYTFRKLDGKILRSTVGAGSFQTRKFILRLCSWIQHIVLRVSVRSTTKPDLNIPAALQLFVPEAA